MVKAIVRDPLFLAQKSVPATEADKQVVQDLLDTLRANLDRCVGMAANMIGVRKNIIVVAMGPFQFAMINPVITKKKEASDRRRMPVLGWCETLYKIQRNRSGLSGSELQKAAWNLYRLDSADHSA